VSADVNDGSVTALETFLARFRDSVRSVTGSRIDLEQMSLRRGVPPFALREMLSTDPLSVFIPAEHGGPGFPASAGLAAMEVAAYEHLPLSLLLAINGLLFLQPVARYARPEVQGPIFQRFLRDRHLAGLMLTEPGHGSDVLNMQTGYTVNADGSYHLTGTKHWAGLTGWADLWLLTARRRDADGTPTGAPDFFICDANRSGQRVVVEEYFENLGLYMIPYGRNRIDVVVPPENRLERETSGMRMLLDMLHRSRLHFSGMAAGFVRRILDEALEHCRERHVGGASLLSYDQVKHRVARLEAAVTACNAMCLHASRTAGVEHDLSRDGLLPNSIKTVCTDMMQESAQSLLQLVGAKGYRLDHFAGRAVVDSRPYQIFEGSNDILYEQIGESTISKMTRAGERNLLRYLGTNPATARAADRFHGVLDVDLAIDIAQRKAVALGGVVSRVVVMELTIALGERGFRGDLIDTCLHVLREDVEQRMAIYRVAGHPLPAEDYGTSGWLSLTRPARKA
jgi:alkylation response protein AidB-like acyl-CoA dehydrogenase